MRVTHRFIFPKKLIVLKICIHKFLPNVYCKTAALKITACIYYINYIAEQNAFKLIRTYTLISRLRRRDINTYITNTTYNKLLKYSVTTIYKKVNKASTNKSTLKEKSS